MLSGDKDGNCWQHSLGDWLCNFQIDVIEISRYENVERQAAIPRINYQAEKVKLNEHCHSSFKILSSIKGHRLSPQLKTQFYPRESFANDSQHDTNWEKNLRSQAWSLFYLFAVDTQSVINPPTWNTKHTINNLIVLLSCNRNLILIPRDASQSEQKTFQLHLADSSWMSDFWKQCEILFNWFYFWLVLLLLGRPASKC